ncbi:hypothetical protein FOIG_11172 [Fusarium odoratissimum NRRL 54006]|uniref:Pyruvate decarboxylase n=1 Tax=Fusarium odoratissimum (strain NRRL 54006) TaxID=1089451 RepID=X0J4R9_FUSO5|nr:uncharacterized protein FOIG_11172 [Fusarium odoratissimum NRRL 54006]EXL96203.1 hypothetical protein FOIG_11172 [Fusarium odoratissimum NRRL 54006]
MHAYATVTQAGLDNPRTSAEKIDETLKQYLLYSRPVYIEVPVDMVVKPVSRLRPESPSVTSEGEKDEASDAVFRLVLQKTVLFIGEGSFQMTVQEITSIVRHSLDVTIFVINNDGCPIDRSTHGRLFGAKEVIYTRSAKTWRDLKHVLEDEGLLRGKELRMVEIFLGREDFPKGPLLHYLEAQRQAE